MIRSLLLMLAASPLLCADPAPAEPGKASPFGPGPGGDAVQPVEPKTLPAPDPPVAPVEPPITELDADRMQIGEVIFNKKTREIRVPAAVNMAGGELLEFALVHTNGKVHESLLVTEIPATHINIAFKLLRYPASSEFYAIVEKDGTMSNEFPKVTDDVKAAARINIELL